MKQLVRPFGFVALAAFLIFAHSASAQIPSGYVQANATVPALANGSFGASWTNLSSSPQLGLLGCTSTFQTTVNGTIDTYGKFSVLLADPTQICPTPSTWTFTFSCHISPAGFITQITIAGGGSAEDITSQILAAAPSNLCQNSGGNLTIQTNESPNLSQTLLNFVNPTSFNGLNFAFSNPSGGIETFGLSGTLDNSGLTNSSTTVNGQSCTLGGSCTVTTPATTVFQHNGTNLPDQAVLNFLDATPSLPTGYVPVTFSNDGAGGLGGYVPPVSIANGSGIQMSLTPPSSGQWVYIFPTSFTTSATGATYTADAGNTSAQLGNNAYCSLGSGTATVAWTGFGASLAALGISPSDVTAIYPFAYEYNPYGPGGGTVCGPIGAVTYPPNLLGFTVSGTGTGATPVTISPATSPISLQYFTGQLVGLTAGNFNSLTVTASVSVGGSAIGPAQASVPLVGAWIQYTGTPVTQPGKINVVAPLNYDAITNNLSLKAPIDAGTDTGTADNYAVSIPWLSPSPATTVTFVPAHTSLTTTPQFNLNGVGNLTVLGPTGSALSAGDFKVGVPATIKYGTGNNLYLQNPQVSGSGSAITGLTGDVTATGPGNVAATLANTAVSPGSYTTANITVDSKGRITAASNGSSTGGVSSLNSLTGGLSLTSTGSTITITPSGSTIDLETSGGGGSGVQYNPSNTQIVIMGASNNGDDQGNTLGPTFPVSSWTGNGTTCSIVNTGNNLLSANDWVYMRNTTSWPNTGALQVGVTLFQVSATGLSSTTFQFPCNITGSGSGGTFEAANGFLPFVISREPFFNDHGVVTFIGDTAQSLASNFSSVVGTATTSPAFLILDSIWTNDVGANKRTPAQIEADLYSIWSQAHTNGWTVVQGFDNPIQWNTSNIGNTSAFQNWFAVYKWIVGQGPSAFNTAPYCTTTCGQYWDRSVDNASVMRDQANTNLFNNTNLGVYSVGGVKRLADYYNAAMSTQGSITGSYPYYVLPAPFASGSLYGSTFGNVFAPTGDSHQAFNFENAALTTDYLNIDTVNNVVQFPYLAPATTSCLTIASGNGQLGTASCGGLSGMTAGQVPIAATATTVTSSKALAGTGTGIATGPTTSTANDIATYADTAGTQQDSGVAVTNVVTSVSPSSPITASISGHTLLVACPTCGTSTGGTNVSQNSGSAETNLPITGFMPQACADTSGSGTAQSCTVANTFVPQANNCIVYTTTTANNTTALTVNVNSLGAKSVAVSGSSGWTTTLSTSPHSIPANEPMHLCYDGTNWNASGTGVAATASSTINTWQMDPFYSTPSSTASGPLQFSCSSTGGNLSQPTPQSTTANHNGIWQISGLSSSNTHAECFSGNKLATIYLASGAGSVNIVGEANVPNGPSTAVTIAFGISTGNTGPNPTNEIGFFCDQNTHTSSTNWWFGLGGAGVDTGVSCNAGWHQLQMSVSGLTMTGYVDGASVGTATVVAGNYLIFMSGWNHATGTIGTLWMDWVMEQEPIPSAVN